jgi:nuclear pore complex protein Nup205
MIRTRIAALRHERRQLGHILFIIAIARELGINEINKVVRWLSTAEGNEEGLTLYVFTAALAAVDPTPDLDVDMGVDLLTGGSDAPKTFFRDPQHKVLMNSVVNLTAWKEPQLQAAMKLQWSLFLLEDRRRDPHLQGENLVVADEVASLVRDAIRGDAFKMLSTLVFLSRQREESDDLESANVADLFAGSSSNWRNTENENLVEPDFRPYLLQQFDITILNFISTMSPILREIKRHEEDASFAATRMTQRNLSNPPMRKSLATEPPKAPRNDVESFFRLIAYVYQEKEPDAALQFWVDDGTGKLFSFLKWAADSRQPGMVMAMYDMLAALARGPNCSAYAYNFLSSGGGQYAVGTGGNNQVYAAGPCSWSTLFGALEHYSTHLPNRQSTHASTSSSLRMSSTAVPAAQTATGAAASINFALPPEEVNLLRSFLLVLRTVVFFSPTARAALYENPTYRAMSSMFNLVVSLIPIELKSSIFETIAAFCSPGAGALGSDIIRQTWTILERFEILPVKKGAVAFGRGVLAELEQVEAVGKQYPGTTALIHLLNALVRVSGKKSGGSDAELSTIPENLGAGYRTAGVGPYVRFVIDEVFLKTAHRDFKFEAERWKVREACLCFMENCLAGFDLSALYREDFSNLNSRNASKAISTLAGVVTHPGSQVLLRILRDEAVRALIINFAAEGCQAISQGLIKTHYAKLCILRSLRIIHRVLEVEGVYIEGLVPLLHQVDTIPNVATDDIPPLSIPFLELSLLQSQQCVPNIARFVSLDGEDEMALLAIQILDELSQSRYFNTPSHGFNTASALRVDSLVVCLKDSEYLDHILDGFVQYLEPDPDDDPSLDDDPEVNSDTDTPSHLSHSIRSAILRLLLRNTQIGHRAPNIAHLLLGFAARGADVEVSVEDPKAANSRTSCLHAILDMLNVGVPRLDRKVRKGVPSQTPLSTKNPELAEKCYRLIFQLCSHTFTSSSTMRYLRTREDFFVRHLASLPMKAPSSPQVADGEVTYADTSSSRTTCRKFTAFVRLRAWVLDSVALELHVLTESAQHQKSAKLLELLFSSSSSVSEDPEDSLLGAAPGQSLIRVLEIFDTLSVQWTDYAAPADMNLQFYASIDWNASLREDENGCPIYDSSVLLSLMTSTRRQYQQQGALGADGVQRLLKAETKYVLESAVVENHRREIEYAKLMAYEAWRRVLDISLAKAFDRLPQEQREGILFDTLQAIPPVLAASVTSSPTAILLSEVILSLITKLREDHHNQLVLQTSPQDSFAASVPTDRLHVLFKSILDCLLNSVNTERARGNLYAALTNYLQLVLSTGDRGLSQFSENPNTPSDDMSLADEAFAPSTSRARPSTEQSALKLGTLQIVNQIAERLVVIVCGDAIDGSEVWKTVAFTLLDSLVRLSRADKAHRVLSVLVKHGFLQNFVQSVKESGFELQRVLKPDPRRLLCLCHLRRSNEFVNAASLNALYVYEAKMSFLVRIAQTRQGADKLLNCRIFPLLSQCEFLASRPEKDQDFEGLPFFVLKRDCSLSAFHQILTPFYHPQSNDITRSWRLRYSLLLAFCPPLALVRHL